MMNENDVLDDLKFEGSEVLNGTMKEWFRGAIMGSLLFYFIAYVQDYMLNHLMLFPCGPIKMTNQYYFDFQSLFSSSLIFLTSFIYLFSSTSWKQSYKRIFLLGVIFSITLILPWFISDLNYEMEYDFYNKVINLFMKDNILDDIDSPEEGFVGTTAQLFRGLLLGVFSQVFLWLLFFYGLGMLLGERIFDLINFIFLASSSLAYEFNALTIVFFLVILGGSGSFIFLSNGRNQTFKRILPLGWLFSLGSALGLFIILGIQNGGTWQDLFTEFYELCLIMMIIQFVLVINLFLFIKNKRNPITIFMFIVIFLAMGFVPK